MNRATTRARRVTISAYAHVHRREGPWRIECMCDMLVEVFRLRVERRLTGSVSNEGIDDALLAREHPSVASLEVLKKEKHT